MEHVNPPEGSVVSVNISERQGTSKQPVDAIVIDSQGVSGDAHAGHWHRQVSLLAAESIERFSREAGQTFLPGEFAENITTRGVGLADVAILDRLLLGGSVELEVTQLGKECHGSGCAIFQQVGRCVMPKEGVFTRVIRGGTVRPGDVLAHKPRILRCRIVTLSDRASQGVYPDRGGPRVRECLERFAREKRWQLDAASAIIPDDADQLRGALIDAQDAGVHTVFTTGSTGLGPRDIAPEVVSELADKIIPGIMEHIRIKYGADKPNALLSRSVAAIFGHTLVYTLPGSVKAVDEYMAEILKTIEHAIFMLHGLDTH
ncbi:MAG TPA: molybdopterin-binding protein [Candidatus Hydrogenedentes bacterium]|nr:molybdopterin-binding protein [Candidatus Hydrogenedentota bacterium]HRT19398.1 molybdopterin-binding protein [Candidatus Hydrogenedentota bacterium]HRT63868.1 molybdopterin-binding protein [Candidatus Hydrogenedentota bacterium]